jgi:peroxiredoxin-like protein
MHPFPHHYSAAAIGNVEGDVDVTVTDLPRIRSASPAEFGGPGDRWSPETLLVGAVADCFVLTFRAVARASKLPWTSLQCEAVGTLDRTDRLISFTDVTLRARLVVPAGTDVDRARRAMEKAEEGCLISNSLKASIHLVPEVDVEPAAALAGVTG